MTKSTDKLQRCPRGTPLLERFNSKWKYIKETGCWEWQRCINDKGYGQLNENNKSTRAHRISYELFIGDIAEGLFVCHKCDNRKCVSPFHLFLGTNEDNMKDAQNKGRLQKVTHPSLCHYIRYKCRCDECKHFSYLSKKEYRAKNSEKIKLKKKIAYYKNKNSDKK